MLLSEALIFGLHPYRCSRSQHNPFLQKLKANNILKSNQYQNMLFSQTLTWFLTTTIGCT